MCAALHDESEEDTFRSQGEASSRHSVMDDEVVHENHEHRDDAQQLDAGISPPPHSNFENEPARRVGYARGRFLRSEYSCS